MRISISPHYIAYKAPSRFVFSVVFGVLAVISGCIVLALTYWIYASAVLHTEAFMPANPLVYIGIYLAGFAGRLVYEAAELYLCVRDSRMEVNGTTLEVVGGGIRQVKVSYPLTKVSQASVHQSLTDRLLGMATVVISGEFDENVSFEGAGAKDADAFIRALLSKRT